MCTTSTLRNTAGATNHRLRLGRDRDCRTTSYATLLVELSPQTRKRLPCALHQHYATQLVQQTTKPVSLTKLCKGLQCEEINPTFFSTVTNDAAQKTVHINIHVVRTFHSFSLQDRPPFKTTSLVVESHCPLLQTA